jgi:hypothetical protein
VAGNGKAPQLFGAMEGKTPYLMERDEQVMGAQKVFLFRNTSSYLTSASLYDMYEHGAYARYHIYKLYIYSF